MATLKDIANKAEVTISTVSRALNGNEEINKETRKRIVQIARELNYVSNKNEKEYCGSTLKTIGLICPEFKSNFYSSIANTIGARIKASGYAMIVGLTDFKYENELHYLNLFEEKNVDGIVFITGFDQRIKEDLINFKMRCSIPLVQLASFVNVEEYDCIKIDESLAVNLAFDHLVELGHRDIAFLGENFTRDRQKYFMDALKKHEMKIDSDFIRAGEERFEEAGYLGMKEILALKGKMPTAVFASYDDIAIGAMKAIFEHGLRIPEDISVVGIDDIYLARYLNIALSTVSSPVDDMTNIALKILLGKIEDSDNKTIQHVVIKPKLIIRETTARVIEK